MAGAVNLWFHLKSVFHRETPEEKFARGRSDAIRFLAGYPSRREILEYWSGACEGADLSPGGSAYAMGAKEVLRPVRDLVANGNELKATGERSMDTNAQAVVEDGAIAIRISVSNLPQIVEGAWAAGGMDMRCRVTDADKFAEELCRELNAEDGEGTTAVHRMFDAAIIEAFEQGAEGIEEHGDQDG